jgi:hypothetical protein
VNATLDTLIGALYGHRACHCLPEPVTVGFDLAQLGIEIQVSLADTASALLAWARSLDQVTVSGWRHQEDRLHLTVLGRTIGGIRVRVYGGMPYAPSADLLTVAVDQSVPLTLDELALLCGLLADTPAGAA